jgi:phenylacetate-CoA ligase
VTTPLGSKAKIDDLMVAVRSRKLFQYRRRAAKANYLTALLRHASRNVPFYRESAMRPREHLHEFPLTSRPAISASPEQFIATNFVRADMFVQTTSGTTGEPLCVARDHASFFQFVYETFAQVFRLVPELPARPKAGTVSLLAINDNPDRQEQVVINPSLGYGVAVRKILGRTAASDRELISYSLAHCPPLLHARPRALLRFAELIREGSHAAPHPKALLCSGDNLYQSDRNFLEEVFQAPVYNAYASQEGGFIAMECSHHCGLHVLPERAVVEVLQETADVSPSYHGQGELVITNLENWGMPFIRYVTGDSALVDLTPCSCGSQSPRIQQLDGRDSTYFYVKGRRVNPSVLNPIFEHLPIGRFQVKQTRDLHFVIRWVPRLGAAALCHVDQAIAEGVRSRFGDVPLTVERMEELRNSATKVQRYVREGS